MPFVSNYERALDDKNRFQIPSEFRTCLDPEKDGKGFYLCPGERDNTLALYPPRGWESMVKNVQTRCTSSEDALDFEQYFYSVSCRLEMDSQGRVVLPERQLGMVNLGKEITLAGANDRIEIWRASEYRDFIEKRQREWPKLQKYLRMAGSGWKEPGPSSSV